MNCFTAKVVQRSTLSICGTEWTRPQTASVKFLNGANGFPGRPAINFAEPEEGTVSGNLNHESKLGHLGIVVDTFERLLSRGSGVGASPGAPFNLGSLLAPRALGRSGTRFKLRGRGIFFGCDESRWGRSLH